MLRDYDFQGQYNKLQSDIANDFYIPCMRNSIRYDRISGYFGSTIYIIAWNALREFIANNGKMRIICSPYLSEEDSKALEEGNKAKRDEILKENLKNELNNLLRMEDLSVPSRLFACLIASGTIEMKLAIPRLTTTPDIKRLFHDKTGVFVDSCDDAVAFGGSFNETFKGLANDGNIESVFVFQSWDSGKDPDRVNTIRRGFEHIWKGDYSSVDLFDLPSETKEYINDISSHYSWDELLKEIEVKKSHNTKWLPNKQKLEQITLRKNQSDALEQWEKNNYKGIYKGCTGCGKTIIAICAIRHELDLGNTVLILVPSKILLYHWRDEIQNLIDDIDINFLLCGDNNNAWRDQKVLESWTRYSQKSNKIIISTMDTASTYEFIGEVNGGNHLSVFADEVHRMGSKVHRRFFDIKCGHRLGLSATPERFGDPEGTIAIINYFGDIMQPEYTISDALRDKVLTPYFYHINTVSLDADEQEQWNEITKKISKLYAISANKDVSQSTKNQLEILAIQRSRIVKKAKGKIAKALEIIQSNYKNGQRWLVYCDDIDQLKEVSSKLRENNIRTYEYYAEMEGDREQTLKYFSIIGGVLVSIKCLDEGVDIPSTTHALILASSQNPREFIQRRGRILRTSVNKTYSTLFDIITIPAVYDGVVGDKSLSIIETELARAIDFGKNAENKSCVSDLKIVCNDFGIDYRDFLDGGYENEK